MNMVKKVQKIVAAVGAGPDQKILRGFRPQKVEFRKKLPLNEFLQKK